MVTTYRGDLYKILLVTKTATPQEIKASYRKLAIKFHPDKNKSGAETFKDISYAYNILSDPEQRSLYDARINTATATASTSTSAAKKKNTKKAPKKPFEGYTKPCAPTEEIIYNFFQRESYCIYVTYTASLRQVYNGSIITVEYIETLSCPKCLNGVKKVVKTCNCSTCKGHGAIEQISPLTPCHSCKGTGREIITLICTRCQGSPKTETRTAEVTITQGLFPRQAHLIKNKGNLMHDGLRGDIVVTVIVDLHDEVFALVSPEKLDLRCICKISLEEALLGFENRSLCTHMDGKNLVSSHPPGNVIKPGSSKHVPGEGMPSPTDPTKRGNLEVVFEVEFPDAVYPTANSLDAVRRLFSGAPSPLPSFIPFPSVTQVNLGSSSSSPSTATTNEEGQFTTTPRDFSGDQLHIPPRVKRSSANEGTYVSSPDMPSPEPLLEQGELSPSRKRGFSLDDDDEESVLPSRKRSFRLDDDDEELPPRQTTQATPEQEGRAAFDQEYDDDVFFGRSANANMAQSFGFSPTPYTLFEDDGPSRTPSPAISMPEKTPDIIVIDDDDDDDIIDMTNAM